MHTPLAIGCAILAAIALGVAGRFQHGAVKEGATGGRLALRQVLALLRHRRWLVGTALVLFGVGLHMVALGLAPLTVVQPIGVLSLVAIVLIGDGHHQTDRATWYAVAATCAGTAGFVLFARNATGHAAHSAALPPAVQYVVLAVLLVTAVAALCPTTVRCVSFAVCAATLFGLTSALMRPVLQSLFTTGLTWWVPLVAAEAGALALLGGLLVQQAYAARPPAVVLGTITVGDPVTAVVVGMALYGEAAHLTVGMVAGELACTVIAVAGVAALVRQVPRSALVPAGGVPA